MLRARKAHAAAQSAPQQRIAPARARQVEALVGADEHDDGVRRVAAGLAGGQLAPVGEALLRQAGADVRVALDLDPLPHEPPGELGVERHRQRVAGDEQPPERAPRRRVLAELRGVERGRRHRGHPAARRAGAAERARGAALVVLQEGERVVGRLVERQPVGDPAGGRADRAQHVALGPRLLVLAGVPDRRPLEQHEQQHGEQHDDHRVAGGQPAAGGRVERGLGHQNWK